MTEEPNQPPQRSPWPGIIGGFFLAGILGVIANIIAGIVAMSQHSPFLGFFIGGAPGVLLAVIGLVGKRMGSLSTGILIGGCCIALLGGACGAAMVGTTFH